MMTIGLFIGYFLTIIVVMAISPSEAGQVLVLLVGVLVALISGLSRLGRVNHDRR